MSLAAGDKLGPYEIVVPIGKGGMGEVYRARDPRLRRDIAIKISAGEFSKRFAGEARAIAALNHPHICSLYDVGPDFLVMEYVQGEPLKGPLPPGEALRYAVQICDALDAAHRKGITHRDLKPGNILVGEHGVKVLDFGLAKVQRAESGGETQTIPLTEEASIVGTLAYMAPEQFQGKEADARSDIFALGVVLYELISGERPFAGPSQSSLIASILKEQPRPLDEVQPSTPRLLDRVIQTCLEKDPEKRWQSASELKHALEWTAQGATAGAPSADREARKLRPWQAVAALATLTAVGLAGLMFWPRSQAAARVTILEAPLPETAPSGTDLSISPDARKLVISGAASQDPLSIRDLETPEWKQLPGSEGGLSPFWSPDGRLLAFGVGNQLKTMDAAGGPPQTLCAVPTDAVGPGAWNREGVIVFGSTGGGSGGPIWKISQAGGVPTAITEVDASRGESYHSMPSFLPDGRRFVYFRSGAPEVQGVYAGSIDAKPGAQSRKRILAGAFGAVYVNGYLLFIRENTLMAQRFDATGLEVRDEPVPVQERVATTWFNAGMFSVSPGGVLIFKGTTRSGSFQLTWLDREGKPSGVVGEPNSDQGIWLSPDGTRGLVRETHGESAGDIWAGRSTGDLWTIDLARGLRTRLTFRQNAGGYQSVWSPDGRRIAFAGGNLLDTLYEKPSSGAGDEKELLKEPGRIHVPTSWSRDGRFLLYYVSNTPRTGYDVWLLPLEGDRKPVLLLGGVFNEWAARFSPDMRWIVYASTESGDAEVYVRPFLAAGPSGTPALGEGKWQVSRGGGNWPRWRADGREIFYQHFPRGNGMLAVEVKTIGEAFESGVPQQLFQGPIDNGWDVTPDGKRFLVAASQVRRSGLTPITVVLNWEARLKR